MISLENFKVQPLLKWYLQNGSKERRKTKKIHKILQNSSFSQVECRRTPVLYAFRVQFQDEKKKGKDNKFKFQRKMASASYFQFQYNSEICLWLLKNQIEKPFLYGAFLFCLSV